MFGWLTGKRKRVDDTILKLAQAAAIEERLSSVQQAIGTVSATKLDGDKPTANAALASAALTRAIISKTIGQIETNDDRLVSGVFAFVYANYFSHLLSADFELAAFDAFLKVVKPEINEVAVWFDIVMQFYNGASASNSNMISAIGKTCERWYKDPTPQHFEDLTGVFVLVRQHIIQEATLVRKSQR